MLLMSSFRHFMGRLEKMAHSKAFLKSTATDTWEVVFVPVPAQWTSPLQSAFSVKQDCQSLEIYSSIDQPALKLPERRFNKF